MAVIPGLGIGLMDIARAGADVFNAKNLGEMEAERLRREEEERNRQRRQEALAMALNKLNLERGRTALERDETELERIRRGETPTPTAGRRGTLPMGAGTFEEALERLRRKGDVDREIAVKRARETTRAREEVQQEFERSGNEPPSELDIRRVSEQMIESVLAGNPLISVDEAVELALSEEARSTLSPAIQALIEGGRINNTTLRSAFFRARGRDQTRDARYNQLIDSVEQACAAGLTVDQIEEDLLANPFFVELDADVQDQVLFRADSCSGG